MKKSIMSVITILALTGTLGFSHTTSAQEVTVQKGDTLWGIAHKHQISIEELKDWNSLTSDLILPNDQLKVAVSEKYKVQPGDTLTEIATKFDYVTWKMIQDWNQIDNPEIIKVGQTLTIYTNGQADNKAFVKKDTVTEKVVTTKGNKKQEQPKQEKEVIGETEHSNTEEKTDNEVAQELTVSATAYTASCNGCSGITATGINLLDNPNTKVISVDPSVIPLGSKVYVEGYGHAIAGDTGGAIVGNKIDLFIPKKQDAINWGVRDVKVTVYK